MEYGQREPLKSAPANERTTLMMRSIKELLTEQGMEHLLEPKDASEAATIPPMRRPEVQPEAPKGLQQPPFAQVAAMPRPAPADQSASFAPCAKIPMDAGAVAETAPAPASRSLLGRLLGR